MGSITAKTEMETSRKIRWTEPMAQSTLLATGAISVFFGSGAGGALGGVFGKKVGETIGGAVFGTMSGAAGGGVAVLMAYILAMIWNSNVCKNCKHACYS